MGFITGMRDLHRMGKELHKDWDAGAQLAASSAAMGMASHAIATQVAASAAGSGGAPTATATITGLRHTGTVVGFTPLVEIDLLVVDGLRPPWPATRTFALPLDAQPKASVGREVAVWVDASTGDVAIDWVATAP